MDSLWFPAGAKTRLGIKWECGEEGPNPGFQIRSCPRNCERRAHPHRPPETGRRGEGRRPASQETSRAREGSNPPSEGRQGGLMNTQSASRCRHPPVHQMAGALCARLRAPRRLRRGLLASDGDPQRHARHAARLRPSLPLRQPCSKPDLERRRGGRRGRLFDGRRPARDDDPDHHRGGEIRERSAGRP